MGFLCRFMLTSIRLFKKLITAFVFTSVFLIFISISIPVIMDISPVQKRLSSFIANRLQEALHLKGGEALGGLIILLQGVKLDRVSVALFPFPSIEFTGVKITTPPLHNLTIEKVLIRFSTDSIIKKKILIKSITLENPLLLSSASLLSIQFKGDNLFDYFEPEQKDFSIEINNLSSDIFKKADISLLISPPAKSIAGDITIHDFRPHSLFSTCWHDTNKNAIKADSESKEYKANKAIKIDKIICSISVTENESTIKMNNIAFPPFSSELSVDFRHHKNDNNNKDGRKCSTTSLLFAGKGINIDELRDAVLRIMPDNHIAGNIFGILYGGAVKKIEVLFQSVNTPDNHLGSTLGSEEIKNLFNPGRMVIKGDVKKGTINIPATNLTATETDAMVIVKNGILHTEIMKGAIKTSKVNSGTLDVNLLKPDHGFSGEFDIYADLAHLNIVLQELLPKSPVSKELGMLHNIQGETRGTLKLEGKKNRKPSISVTAHDIKLNGEYQRFPQKFSITDGQFHYNDKMISLDNLNGTVGESTFSNLDASLTLDKNHLLKINSGSSGIVLQNSGNLSRKEYNLSSGRTDIVIEQVLPWLTSLVGRESILSILTPSTGVIHLKEIAFKGRLMDNQTWDYLFVGECNSLTLRQSTDSYLLSDKGKISDIKADFLLSPSMTRIDIGNACIEDTSLISESISSLMKSGLIHKDILKDMSIVSDIKTPFSLKNVYFEQKIKPHDEISEKDSDESATSLKGELIFNENSQIYLKKSGQAKNALYNIKIFDKGIESATILYGDRQGFISFTGKLNTKTLEDILNPLSDTYKSLVSLSDGKEIIFESNQTNNYTITTKELDLKFILEKQKMISLPLPMKDGLSKEEPSKKKLSPIVINLNSDSFIHKKITIAPFSARINIRGSDKKITIENMKLCNINGSTEINIKKDISEFSITLQDDNKNIEPVIACFYHGERLMQGNYSLKASLYSQGASDNWTDNKVQNNYSNEASINIESLKNNLKHNLAGTIKISSNGGRIFRLTLLSRILSLLNVSKLMEGKFPDIEQNGFGFSSINIVANVEKSRIILTQAVINGLDMTLLFVGSIDILTREIDLTCLVAPFKTADNIIGKIPIINTMLGGRLISVPVKATGSLNNPQLTILDPSEVGKNIIKTMRDILTTPFKLIDSLQFRSTEDIN